MESNKTINSERLNNAYFVPLSLSRLRKNLEYVVINNKSKDRGWRGEPFISKIFILAKCCVESNDAQVQIHLLEEDPKLETLDILNNTGWIEMDAGSLATYDGPNDNYKNVYTELQTKYFTLFNNFVCGNVLINIYWHLVKDQSILTYSKFLSRAEKRVRAQVVEWAGYCYKLVTDGKCGNCGSDEFIITYAPTKVFAKHNKLTNEWSIEKPVYDPNIANADTHDKIHCAKCKTYHQAPPLDIDGLCIVNSEREQVKRAMLVPTK